MAGNFSDVSTCLRMDACETKTNITQIYLQNDVDVMYTSTVIAMYWEKNAVVGWADHV